MAVYTKRVQTVLTEEQYQSLSRFSIEQDKPLSVLIRFDHLPGITRLDPQHLSEQAHSIA